MDAASRFGRGIWNVNLWIALGLLFYVLSLPQEAEARSPFWFLEIILYGLMISGIWLSRRYDLRDKISIPDKLAPAAYIGLVWLLGMIFEASLTVTGEGVGGVHPQTIPSFILAQGDYIPIAIFSYLAIRCLRLSFHQTFFLAGGKSLTEGLIFTGALTAVITSPGFVLAPLVLAYYTLAYSSFIALPLLIIDERRLWRGSAPIKKRSIAGIWLLGFALALGIRLFWGLIYSPLVISIFNLPPNTA